MMSFLKIKHNGGTLLNPIEPEIDQTQFPTKDWSASPYGPCKDDNPSKPLAHGGIGFTMRAFVESFHYSDVATLRS